MTHGETRRTSGPDVSVVMLAYGAEPWLDRAISAVLASEDVEVELILVDNGCDRADLVSLCDDPRVQMMTPGANLGFTGGVNLAARCARAPVLALVNSDAEVEPQCLARLARALDDIALGVVGALVVLADDPSRVNSAGNPLQVLGLSWAGGLGDPVSSVPSRRSVASASGACLALRRSVWEELGGFPDFYFAYLEDLELCWRVWQRGLRVEVEASARAHHHYEFSRNPRKMYLLERNRHLLLLTAFEGRTLALVALPLLAFEIAVCVLAVAQGWWREKLRGWVWVVRHTKVIRARRRLVQATRQRSDRDLRSLLTTRVDPGIGVPAVTPILEWALGAYWRAAQRALAKPRRSGRRHVDENRGAFPGEGLLDSQA